MTVRVPELLDEPPGLTGQPRSVERLRQMRWAAAVWLGGAIAYLAAEFFAAQHFVPNYGVARNFISDLGVTVCGQVFQGRQLCSPKHDLMNMAFIVEGCAFFIGALLARRWAAPQGRGFVLAAGIYGLGMVLIATFHGENSAVADGTFPLHVTGGLLSIVGGNVAAFISSRMSRDWGLVSTHRYASVALPTLSLMALTVLAGAQLQSADYAPGNGIWERGIMYTIVAWQVFTAACFAVASMRATSD